MWDAEDGGLLGALVRATATATDGDQVLRRAAELLVGGLADWVVADRLVDPDLVLRVTALGPDGRLDLPAGSGQANSRRSSAGAGGFLSLVASSPGHLLHLDRDALLGLCAAADPRTRGQAQLVLGLGSREVVVLGTPARGTLAGVLAMGRTTAAFDPADLGLLRTLGLQVGLALDAARLLVTQRSVSHSMQTSLLPPLPQVAGLELAARYQPAAKGFDVGGDWYDVFPLPDGGLALVIGDAAGHDLAAASHMAELRNRLRALTVDRAEGPAPTLQRLDRTGDRLGGDNSGTCLLAHLQQVPGSSGRSLRWSSAGHLPPLLVRRGVCELVETPADLMLGVDADSARTEHEACLAAGDLLLLYTDGLVERRRVPLDERLALLLEQVRSRPGAHPEELADALVETLADGSDDDVAVLVVRVL